MRRLLATAALTAALVVSAAGPATAAPPGDPSPSRGGWSVSGGKLVWRADQRVPMGDAAVEFWSGGKLLGRPRPHPDGRTFSLDLGGARLSDLSVKAGGRRIDREPPASALRSSPAPVPAEQAAHTVDPGRPGPYRTITGDYDLPGLTVPGFPAAVEMRAVVVAPQGAPGARPLALFLHGRHTVCYRGADLDVLQEWPCAPGTEPIPSHRGYLQAQRLLATQGYVTVSISANGVNGQDYLVEDGGAQARSDLVRAHLAKWADWAGAGRADAPKIVRQAPRADLSEVFLMGHSRGGEGVSRAAMDSLTPPPGNRIATRWTIRGMLLLAPTIFGHNPVPDVPSVTLLPGCDGDVFDQQGQMFVDETRGVSRGRALHSALYMVGANHNFFNTEWTPGQSVAPSIDDFDREGAYDPVCSPGTATRLTAAQEQTAGATYIAGAARLFLADGDRVLPLFDGTGVRAPSAGPARVFSHALGARRTAMLIPGPTVRVSGGARICEQVSGDPATSCVDPTDQNAYLAHFTVFGPMIPEPGRYAAELTGGPARFTLPAPVTAKGRQLALRVIVPPNAANTAVGVTAVGTDGRRKSLGTVRLNGLPGTDRTTSYWGQEVRVPLAGAPARIAALELTSSAQAWLLDAWAWSPGLIDPQTRALPRVDLGSAETVEGDTGTKTFRIPVSVTGRGGGVVRLLLQDNVTFETTSRLVTVRPGDSAIDVPVPVTGDTVYAEGELEVLYAKAERGLVIGDHQGTLDVLNDDPAPTLTVDPVVSRVIEGGTLTWRFTISAPSETPYYVITEPRAPTSGPELSSTDVTPEWFRWYAYESPEPSRPLSSTYAIPYAEILPGGLTAEMTIPTATDTIDEPEESVELHPLNRDIPVLTGVVTG